MVHLHLVLPLKKYQVQIKDNNSSSSNNNNNNKTMANLWVINKDVTDATTNLNNKTGGTPRTVAGVQTTTADKLILHAATLIFLPSLPDLEGQSRTLFTAP